MKQLPAAGSILSALAAAVILGGCAGPYVIGYLPDPLEGPPVKFKTPVMVRTFDDRRPVSERFEPDEAAEFRFYSCDKQFKEPVTDGITRALQQELAGAGIEVADAGNFIPGKKPYLRIIGDILHFVVTRREVPIDTLQHGVETLWRREQFSVRVVINVEMIDTLQKKVVMNRVYTSKDSFILRSDMIDAKAYLSGEPTDELHWQTAADEYCIDLLNNHLKQVMVKVRNDVVRLLTPEPKVTDLELPSGP